MTIHTTDLDWQEWGARDPYFAVITDPKYRTENLTEDAKREFFETGRIHAKLVLESCRRFYGEGFVPQSILDFGCGVGRVLLGFSEFASTVVGMDVSDAMLQEAARNCHAHRMDNVTLARSDEIRSPSSQSFDLVHSFIVLQHLHVSHGRSVFASLLQALAPGGVAVLHTTYAKAAHSFSFGQPPTPAPPAPRNWTLQKWLRNKLWGQQLEPANSPKPNADPAMLMNIYHLNELAFLIQATGASEFHAQFTDHGGEYGVMLYVRKPQSADRTAAP